MKNFSKERICAYLAERDLPSEPNFELRKFVFGETFNQGKPEKERYRQHLLEMYGRDTLIPHIFKTPTPYLDYPSFDTKSSTDISIDTLLDDDISLLCKIFNDESIPDEMVSINYLDELLESSDKFKQYYKLFSESKYKPDWCLIRVLVLDIQRNYKERQKYYKYLLDGGLTVHINDGKVIQLANDVYRLTKEINIEQNNQDDLMPYTFRAMLYKSIGDDMAAYLNKVNDGKVSELNRIKYSYQINSILKDALYKGELPVYRPPAFIPVRFFDYPPDFGSLIFWHDIRFILSKKMPKTGMPDKPVFMDNWQEIEMRTLEAQSENKVSDKPTAEVMGVNGVVSSVLIDTKDKFEKESQLHKLIWSVYLHLSKDKRIKAQDVWLEIQHRHQNHDTDKIIQEVDANQILWCSCYGNEQKLKRTSFDKTLSNLKNTPPF